MPKKLDAEKQKALELRAAHPEMSIKEIVKQLGMDEKKQYNTVRGWLAKPTPAAPKGDDGIVAVLESIAKDAELSQLTVVDAIAAIKAKQRRQEYARKKAALDKQILDLHAEYSDVA